MASSHTTRTRQLGRVVPRRRQLIPLVAGALVWISLLRHQGSDCPRPALVAHHAASLSGRSPGRSSRTERPAVGSQPGGEVLPSWEQLEDSLPSSKEPEPPVIDSVLRPERPSLDGLTLFRERHGWCPYSERVWLALEVKGLDYTTVLIDNTHHGPRPSWFRGSTPQIQWDDGTTQGESLDIVRSLDSRYPDTDALWPDEEVTRLANKFRDIFPKNTRPSSRSAFLFSYSGGPVPLQDFIDTLDATDALLGEHSEGPFFYGDRLTAADIAWLPFLERYAEQLPCLHEGLNPRDAERWPRLAAWYDAVMERVPAYGARVRGDNVSWRKVPST
eukprot:TRINITY_DN22836_c0_g1_i1.p1 TRINITY_DN22836_c0_g1~~TRINITY_DN22836_c0_g1_i1.p1  ORF type:complete len:347 (+),score=-0.19 TRINITY_DN22836_c0_g1_i1:51-1043(+)